MPAWIQEGFQEYTRRMPPEIRVELVELKPEERGGGRDVERAKVAESERVMQALPAGATLLALDERGKAVTTQGLSVMLSQWMRDGSHPAFAIGGADAGALLDVILLLLHGVEFDHDVALLDRLS